MTTSESGTRIPERLLRKGRPPCQHFEPDERLFHRIQKQHVVDDRVVNPGVRFPCFSVNREKFSLPEDVLLPCYPDHGICAFAVGDVPKGPCRPGSSPFTYTFGVVHIPEKEDYAHSEVRAYRDRKYGERLDVSPRLKKRFRVMLGQRMVVVRQPLV